MWVDAFPEQLESVVGPQDLRMLKPATPKAKARLRRRSVRLAARLVAYVQLKNRILSTGPGCPVSWKVFGKAERATELHHVRGRLGPLLLDERYLLPVSFDGHRWIHGHPDEARKRGWLAQPGEWNKP